MSTTSDRPSKAHGTDMPVRAVAAATIGTALEWFDFSLYAIVRTELGIARVAGDLRCWLGG